MLPVISGGNNSNISFINTFSVMSSEQDANKLPCGSHFIAFTSFYATQTQSFYCYTFITLQRWHYKSFQHNFIKQVAQLLQRDCSSP